MFFYSKLEPSDKDRRLSVAVWDWDRTSRNDFMGSLSFGISELIKDPVEGWFKLLNDEEGEYYNIRIPPEDENEVERLRKNMEELHSKNKLVSLNQSSFPLLNQIKTDIDFKVKEKIKPTDFTFLTVLGRGSFGKVNFNVKKNK